VKIGSRVKEKVPKESVLRTQEQRENWLEAQREIKINYAEESQEQRKNRLAAQRDNAKIKRAEESQKQTSKL